MSEQGHKILEVDGESIVVQMHPYPQLRVLTKRRALDGIPFDSEATIALTGVHLGIVLRGIAEVLRQKGFFEEADAVAARADKETERGEKAAKA